jgi:hypothetical protein
VNGISIAPVLTGVLAHPINRCSHSSALPSSLTAALISGAMFHKLPPLFAIPFVSGHSPVHGELREG